jgi:DNA repair protein RecO (recombination protein O)
MSESRCSHLFYTITLDAKKTAIALFMVEILSKTLKEQTENRDLFNFIRDSIIQLDAHDFRSENFHLIFIIKLTRFLGFSPRNSAEIQNELKNSLASRWLQTEEAGLLNQMLGCDYFNMLKITNQQRTEILRILLSFYQLHVEQFGLVKSVKVLNQVFS